MTADPNAVQVRPLRETDRSRAAEVLGRAFVDDPMWSAIIPGAAGRAALMTRMFDHLMRTLSCAGGRLMTAESAAVALWLPPGRSIGIRSVIRSGFAIVRSTLAMPRDDRKRMMQVMRQLDRRHKELAPDPHWYLLALGTDPARHGQGLGTALVRDGLRQADRDGTVTYLETESESNVRFYEHLGFEVIEELTLDRLDVPIWLMLRPPEAVTTGE